MQLDLFREIIVDNFAGGGGASTGIEMATGLSVDIAINHDPDAIAMHKVNHPDTEHYCESVWDVDPVKAVKGRKVGLAWFSPDCKHFSKAKGGKPVEKKIRGLAWIAVKWAIAVKPRVIMLENVEEFKTWGPLTEDGYPDDNQKGKTFQSFVKALESLGYEVQFKELRACDYGAPTIRKRFFMVARCDGRQIVWPKPTHGDPNSLEVQAGKLLPWKTSSEIIDWSIETPSIFNRKKDLSPNTLRRINKGIEKFVINNPTPFIIPGQEKAAFLTSYYTETSSNEVRGLSLDSPLHTITAGGNRFALVTAFLTKYYGQGFGQSVDEPLHTITTKDRFGLVTVKSQNYKIIDIGLRMLQPEELFVGQGFPPNYIIDRDYNGKMYPKSKQIARCGNAVPPPFADALVRANLPEMCVEESKFKRNIVTA
jgi:DNA (cytosine-5)-methyltransferase 1